MRLRLSINLDGSPGLRIPINYNAWLVAAVYRWLSLSSQPYADFLHNEGYRLENRVFKLFCFSQLQIRKRRVDADWLYVDSKSVGWLMSSPKEEFIGHLVAGLEKEPEMTIAGVHASVHNVERTPEPALKAPVQFVCLCPITASIWDSDSERNPTRYLEPGEAFVEAVRVNLERKHRLIYGRPASDDRLVLDFDADYIARKKNITKLIDFRGIKVRGVFCPFTADGSEELIRVGYECGFGEKNSIGFGMVEAREDD